MRLQDRYTWFSDWVGVSEMEFLERRHEHICRIEGEWLGIVNHRLEKVWSAGEFSVRSLSDLRQCAGRERSDQLPLFEIIVRTNEEAKPCVDVAHLQSKALPQSLFQVASNFNCAEVAGVWVDMEDGLFVSRHALDVTQGPAASASAACSLITRVHAPFFDEGIVSKFWGQGAHRQVELLGHSNLREHFPVTNGKLVFHGSEPEVFESTSSLLDSVRLGLHINVPAYFGRRIGGYMVCSDPTPIISQVFVAALNMNASLPHAHHLESKTRFLLQAAYEGTYLAAISQSSRQLILTLVGGGSFANPLEWIAQSIAQSHSKLSRRSNLRKVILPLYALNGTIRGEQMDQLLFEALREAGVPEDRILISKVSHFRF